MMGHKLTKKKITVEENNEDTIEDEFEMEFSGEKEIIDSDTIIEGIEIGHEGTSKTKLVVSTFCKALDKIVLDTPGDADTKGKEIDIANSVKINNSISQFPKIIPIILVPFSAIQDIRKGAKDLVKRIKSFFKNDLESLKSSLILITHSDGISLEILKGIMAQSFKDIKSDKSLQKEEKKELCKCINTLAKMITNNQLIIFDPTIYSLEEFQKTLQKIKEIEQPSQKCNYEVQEKSRIGFSNAVSEFQIKIEGFLSNKKFTDVFLYFGIIQILYTFKIPEIDLEKLAKNIEKKVLNLQTEIHNFLENKIKTSIDFSTQDTETIKKKYILLQDASLLGHYLENCRNIHLNFPKFIQQSAEMLLIDFKNYLNNEYLEKAKNVHEKILVFANLVDIYGSSYQSFVNESNEIINDFVKEKEKLFVKNLLEYLEEYQKTLNLIYSAANLFDNVKFLFIKSNFNSSLKKKKKKGKLKIIKRKSF